MPIAPTPVLGSNGAHVAIQAGGSTTFDVRVAEGLDLEPESAAVLVKIGAPSSSTTVRVFGRPTSGLDSTSFSVPANSELTRLVVVPVPASGSLSLSVPASSGTANVSAQVLGYFYSSPRGASYESSSRSPIFSGNLPGGSETTVDVRPAFASVGSFSQSPGPVNLRVTSASTSTIPTVIVGPAGFPEAQVAIGPLSDINPVGVLVQTHADQGSIVVKNPGASAISVTIVVEGGYVWGAQEMQPESPTGGVLNSSANPTVNAILAESPQLTEAEVSSTAQDLALQSGATQSDVLEAMNQELTETIDASNNENVANAAFTSTDTATRSSGSGYQWVKLPTPQRAADIFYSANASVRGLIVHGHAGIFSSKVNIIEAPGGTDRVREVPRLAINVVKGARLMTVEPLTSGQRAGVIIWARSRIGDRYRSNHLHNAFVVTGPVGSSEAAQDCSQLVYGAFRKKAGIDLNPVETIKNLFPALYIADKSSVTPWELVEASATTTYAKAS